MKLIKEIKRKDLVFYIYIGYKYKGKRHGVGLFPILKNWRDTIDANLCLYANVK